LIALWTRNYHTQHEEFDQLWQEAFEVPPRPAHFEASFGQVPPAPDPISSERPLELKVGKETIKIAGRIDRIDVGKVAGREAFVVIDYKSSREKLKPGKGPRVIDGTALQLELYTIATQEVLLDRGGALPWQGGYWTLRDGGFKAWIKCHESAGGTVTATADWAALRQEVEQKVQELVRGIRAGQFPVHSLDDHCTSFCPYSTVCRINQVRSLEKTWPPEQTSPA
jgi:ATP-dependent helicase/DNAse subunit B